MYNAAREPLIFWFGWTFSCASYLPSVKTASSGNSRLIRQRSPHPKLKLRLTIQKSLEPLYLCLIYT